MTPTLKAVALALLLSWNGERGDISSLSILRGFDGSPQVCATIRVSQDAKWYPGEAIGFECVSLAYVTIQAVGKTARK